MLWKAAVSTPLVAVLLARALIVFGDEFDAARSLIDRAVASGLVPSLTVAVARDNRALWTAGFGWADREAKRRATAETTYSIGSLTKPMTATAVMLLEERGLIALDRPANDYLGDKKLRVRVGDASAATVGRLLQHTAGLGTHYQVFFDDENLETPAMARTIERYGDILWPPGEGFRYSNLGYGILGEIIERRSGKSFATFMHDELFEPLAMRHSYVGVDHRPAGEYAVGYGPQGQRLATYRTSHPAAADAWSSVVDLLQFGQMQCRAARPPDAHSRTVISLKAIERMQQCTVRMGKAAYGLGWVVSRDAAGRRRIRHAGAGAGVGAELSIVPDEGLVVAVLVNADTSSSSDGTILPTRVAEAILASLLPIGPQAAATRGAGSEPTAGTANDPPDVLGAWQGWVETPDGRRPVRLLIDASGNALIRLADQVASRLKPSGTERNIVTGNQIMGKFTGDLATADSSRRPYELDLEVCLRDGRLCGSLASISTHPTRGGALAHWVVLDRCDRQSFEK